MLTNRNNTRDKRRRGTVNKDQMFTVWDVKHLDRTLWSKATISENHEWALLAAHESGRMSMLRSIMNDGDSDSMRWFAYRCAQDFITDMEEQAS